VCYDMGETDGQLREVSAITMDIGKRIREAREEYGMSGVVLARRAGVSSAHLNMIEHGSRTPSLGLLEKIAHELRTEPAEFLREPALAGKAGAPSPGQDVWRAIANEAFGADLDEVLIPTTRLTPELFPSVLEILNEEAHQLENLHIVIDGGYIKAGLRAAA